jgi:FixJ family two-component response regulator
MRNAGSLRHWTKVQLNRAVRLVTIHTMPSDLVAVVDDDSEVRVALMRLLSSAGFATEAFESGAQFVQSIGEQTPACVVLDLHMPGLSGFDVQQQLVERHPEVPVVIITGHDTAEARRRAVSLGARAYLSKPVDGDALLLAISEALHH